MNRDATQNASENKKLRLQCHVCCDSICAIQTENHSQKCTPDLIIKLQIQPTFPAYQTSIMRDSMTSQCSGLRRPSYIVHAMHRRKEKSQRSGIVRNRCRKIKQKPSAVRRPPFSPDSIVLVFSKYPRSWRRIEDSIDVLMP
jgi:hypothetical protein